MAKPKKTPKYVPEPPWEPTLFGKAVVFLMKKIISFYWFCADLKYAVASRMPWNKKKAKLEWEQYMQLHKDDISWEVPDSIPLPEKNGLSEIGIKIKDALIDSGMTPGDVDAFVRDYKPHPDYAYGNNIFTKFINFVKKLF